MDVPVEHHLNIKPKSTDTVMNDIILPLHHNTQVRYYGLVEPTHCSNITTTT